MNSQVLVDTNIVSYFVNKHTFYEAYRRFLADKHWAISFMTVFEVRFGLLKRGWSPQLALPVEEYLASLSAVHSNTTICDICAEIVHARHRRPIGQADAWIAATAIWLDCPLVTHDADDFSDIPGLELVSRSSA